VQLSYNDDVEMGSIMLERVLEPEVMDSAEEAHDYDAMDHSTVNRVFVRDFLSGWNGRSPILDVGTGTAQIPIEFCRQSAEGTLVGIDLAEHMLAVGRLNIVRESLLDRIQLQKVNARGMPFADGEFGVVMSNSIVHHIPEPAFVFAEMIRVTAPDGYLFVRDLLRPTDEATLRSLVEIHAAGANTAQKKMFAESLHAALTLDEVRAIVEEHGFDPLTVQSTSDRHWTWRANKGKI